MLELNILNLKIVIWIKKYNQLQLFKLWANNNFITQIFTTIRENHAINNKLQSYNSGTQQVEVEWA